MPYNICKVSEMMTEAKQRINQNQVALIEELMSKLDFTGK
jgi:hypothetical protein